jgi:hypothetical protein
MIIQKKILAFIGDTFIEKTVQTQTMKLNNFLP